MVRLLRELFMQLTGAEPGQFLPQVNLANFLPVSGLDPFLTEVSVRIVMPLG